MRSRPRVLVLAGWYPNEDNPIAGVFIRDQARALARVCDVAVVYVHLGTETRPPETRDEDGFPVVRAAIEVNRDLDRSLGHLRNLWRLTVGYCRQVLRSYEALGAAWGRPDIVHAHVFYPAGVGALALSVRHRLPYVVTEHSSECLPQDGGFWRNRGRAVRWLMRRAARGASACIAVSSTQARALSACGLGREHEVVPNVVRRCVEPETRPRVGARRIIHLSTLEDFSKDISGLLSAVAILAEQRTDFELAIVGDGPDRDELERRGTRLGLAGSLVRFRGMLPPDEALRLLSASDFLVVSSRFETFCVSAAEALMCGKPVVCTRCGGPEDYVTGEVGVLVAPEDPAALAAGLAEMLDRFREFDPEAVRSAAIQRFSPEAVSSRVVDIYSRILER